MKIFGKDILIKKEKSHEIKVLSQIKGKKKRIIIGFFLAIILILVLFKIFGVKTKNNIVSEGTDETIETRSIKTTLSSSGTVQPANQYSITASVSGEVILCNFEEGDVVQKGDVLYKVDSSDMENSVERANISYEKTYTSYLDTMKSKDKLNIYSKYDGTIVNMYVKEGEEISNGTKIADIRNNSIMTLKVPFNSVDAKNINVGDKGIVTVDSTFEQLECTVTNVDGVDTVLSGNRIIRYVEIEANNPGAITQNTTGTVMIGNIACTGNGLFQYSAEYTITAGTNGEISSLIKKQGDIVSAYEVFGTITSTSLNQQLSSSELSLKDAKLSYDNTLSQLDNYTITTPITGTVIAKNSKVGDNLKSSNSQTALAIIYDLSYLTFEMSIDELDIGKIKVGQTVNITCDAITTGSIEGRVTNVSVAGTTQNNVTTYPVTVQIDNPPEGLLPGMNIEAEIVVEYAENVVALPVDALQRGNIVYVKGIAENNMQTEENKKNNFNNNVPEGYHSVKVETGISNDYYVEITSGLSAGDVVYVTKAQRTQSEKTNETGFSIPGMSGKSMNNTNRPNMSGNMGGGGMPGGGF